LRELGEEVFGLVLEVYQDMPGFDLHEGSFRETRYRGRGRLESR
jgi:hypothetical protein